MSYAKGASWMHIVDSIQSESKLEVIVPHPTCVRRTLQDVVTKQRMRMLLQCLDDRFTMDEVKCNVSNDWYLANKDHFVLFYSWYGLLSI